MFPLIPSEHHEPLGFHTLEVIEDQNKLYCPSKRTSDMPQMFLSLSVVVFHRDICNLFSDSTVTNSTTYHSNSRLVLVKTRVVIISRVLPLAVIVLQYK